MENTSRDGVYYESTHPDKQADGHLVVNHSKNEQFNSQIQRNVDGKNSCDLHYELLYASYRIIKANVYLSNR